MVTSSGQVASRAHPRSRGEHARSTAALRPPDGSSPLARGALLSCLICCGSERLIPARAGSTARPDCAHLQARAHPRSRGEHAAETTASALTQGSSPLARGARHRARPGAGRAGLIPARAGSTRRCSASGSPRPAHPRSRGEHRRTAKGTPTSTGSSPLGRGARGRRPGDVAAPGLIPARAGSTAAVARGESRRGAHPRSRGEHMPSAPCCGTTPGSSPLARGAHGEVTGRARCLRLIPARAGSTHL